MFNLKKHIIIISLEIFCILQISATQQATGNVSKSARIVGGNTTTIEQINYIVSLRYRNRFICGGSLVSTTHVITAAHCVTTGNRVILDPDSITVHGGSTYRYQAGVVRMVRRISIPSNFRRRKNAIKMDVSVLTLTTPMEGSNIDTIGLCSNRLPVGASVTVSGWGQISENGLLSDQLRTVSINMISRQRCFRNYRYLAKIAQTSMCATRSGSDSCSGDSGGPLVYNGELCGIVSWGIGCARSRYPGVYTAINRVKGFITNAMNEI